MSRSTTRIYKRSQAAAEVTQDTVGEQASQTSQATAQTIVTGESHTVSLHRHEALAGPITKRLNRGFIIERELGRGGFGSIFSAKQQTLNRPVAIKVLHSNINDPTTINTFAAEAIVTANLQHPHIIPVHDFETEGQDLRLVLKKVDGNTWKTILHPKRGDGQAVSLEEHLDILLKVAEAISFAHSRGIIHRDLKPENIMVGHFGEVLVMDWGCAVVIDEVMELPDFIPRQKDISHIVGTPNYMPPEMAKGDIQQISYHSDLYQLGAILYEILCSRPPHKNVSPEASLEAARKGSIQDPREINSSTPDDLAELAMACMEIDPADRIADAQSLKAAIHDYLRHSQADALLFEAKRHATLAKSDSEEADHLYRQAVSACEQALAIWPDHKKGRRLFYEINMASAHHALDIHAWHIAKRQAEAARKIAITDAHEDGQYAANRLIDAAADGVNAAHSREAHVHRMRRIIYAGGLLIVSILSTALYVVADQMHQAQRNLEEYNKEHELRLSERRQTIPAFMSTAELAIKQQKLQEAKTALQNIISIDNKHDQARLHLAQISLIEGDHEAALTFLACNTAPHAQDMHEILLDNTADELVTTTRLTDLFHKMDAPYLAYRLHKRLPDNLQRIQQRLQTDPRLSPCQVTVSRFEDELLHISLRGSAGDKERRSLSVISGLPIGSLSIEKLRIINTEALADLPLKKLHIEQSPGITNLKFATNLQLEYLSIPGSSIADIRALQKAPLAYLNIERTEVASLEPLRNCKSLRTLKVAKTNITDLSPLQDGELKYLDIAYNKITDLSPLKDHALMHLNCTKTGITSLADLSTMPLRTARFSACRIDSLEPLRHAPLQSLHASHTAVSDISVLRLDRMQDIRIRNTKVTDLSMLAASPLTLIAADWYNLQTPVKLPFGSSGMASPMVHQHPRKALSSQEFLQAYKHEMAILGSLRQHPDNAHCEFNNYSLQMSVSADKRRLLMKHFDIPNLANLSAHPITHLTISKNSKLDSSSLAELTLESLTLEHCNALSIRALLGMDSLKHLIVHRNILDDMQFIKDLPLSHLSICSHEAEKWHEEISSMPHLRTIHLYNAFENHEKIRLANKKMTVAEFKHRLRQHIPLIKD